MPTWAGALALGLVALAIRAPGLGEWCFAVDEYYSSRAAAFVLERGAPIFPAGGLYPRGPILHYGAALLSMWVDDPELALRIVPLLAGAAAVPMCWILARRFLSPAAALGLALALAVSSWQVEFARFGRMYSSIQLVFLACVYFLDRAYVGAERRSARAAFGAAYLALFVHEAAILLVPLFVLLPALGERRFAPDARRTILPTLVLFAAAYTVLWVDYQFMDVPPPLPPGVEHTDWQSPLVPPRFDLLAALPGLPALVALWGVGALVAARIVAGTAGAPPLARIGVAAVLGLALAQQVGVALVVLVVLGLVDEGFRDCAWRRRGAVGAALAAAVGFWTAVGWVAAPTWLPGEGTSRVLKETGKAFLFHPELVQRGVLPLARPTPVLAVGIYAAIALGIVRALATSGRRHDLVPLLVVIAGLCVVAWIPAPYYESRYFFALYPLMLLVVWIEACVAGRWLAERGRTWGPRAALVAPCVLFAVGGDFHPRHISAVSSRESAFRLGAFERYQRHWYPRADFESPARWVNHHYREGDVVVVDTVPSPAYLEVPYVDFMLRSGREFPFTSSRGGTTNRWTDNPLIWDLDSLGALVPDDPSLRLYVISSGTSFGGSSLRGENAPGRLAERLGVRVEEAYAEPDGRIRVWRFTRPAQG